LEEQVKIPALLTTAAVGLVLLQEADAVMLVDAIPKPAITA
jgi:hypothetical protein